MTEKNVTPNTVILGLHFGQKLVVHKNMPFGKDFQNLPTKKSTTLERMLKAEHACTYTKLK
jgi:hypothetical protein